MQTPYDWGNKCSSRIRFQKSLYYARIILIILPQYLSFLLQTMKSLSYYKYFYKLSAELQGKETHFTALGLDFWNHLPLRRLDRCTSDGHPQMMIGRHMPRIGQGSRVLLNTCAYGLVVFAVVGGSFAAALAVLPEQNETGTQVAAKIGPGYGRMREIDFGKPDKPVYTAHPTSGAHSTASHSIVITAKRVATKATLPVFSVIAARKLLAPLLLQWRSLRTAPPIFIASTDPIPYIHSEPQMYMSGESLLIILLVGIIAGWLAGQIMRGTGFGLIGDLVIGIIGAFIGGWLLPRLGIHLGVGMVAAIINATIGAMLLLFVLSLVRGGRGWS